MKPDLCVQRLQGLAKIVAPPPTLTWITSATTGWSNQPIRLTMSLKPTQTPSSHSTKDSKRPTLNSIAQALGVSRATVSNAFNRPEIVAEALRERILEHARTQGYFGPDPMARAMRRSEIEEVAVVFHHDLSYALQDPQSVQFLRGVVSELDRRQLVLQLIPKMGRRGLLSAAFQTTADALIVHAEIPLELMPQLKAIHKPLVLVDRFIPGITSIGIDDQQGARAAMEYVLSKSPQTLVIACLPVGQEERQVLMQDPSRLHGGSVGGMRLAGYLQALHAAGFPLSQTMLLEIDDEQPEQAAPSTLDLIRSSPTPQSVGIVCMSDRMALSIWREIKAKGLPSPCALIGFDDIPEAAAAGLSTIRQNSFLKGEQAVRMALDGLDSALLPVELLIRST